MTEEGEVRIFRDGGLQGEDWDGGRGGEGMLRFPLRAWKSPRISVGVLWVCGHDNGVDLA